MPLCISANLYQSFISDSQVLRYLNRGIYSAARFKAKQANIDIALFIMFAVQFLYNAYKQHKKQWLFQKSFKKGINQDLNHKSV